MKKVPLVVGALLFVELLFTTSAMAQTAADTDKVNDTAAQIGGEGLEEIVVTATRQAELLRRVPISVSVMSQDRVDELGIKDFAGVARQTPGVRVNSGGNGNGGGDISIRGVASDAGAATTGVYIDDTPIQIRTFGTGANQGEPTIFDLDRIEILRGPQGTLFGAGSLGGTVRYITPQPSLDDEISFNGRSEVAGTESGDESYELGASVGGKIIQDKVGFRGSAYYRRDGGWIDYIDYHDGSTVEKASNQSDTFAARAAFAFQPVDNLLITPSIDYQRVEIDDTSEYWEFYSSDGEFKSGNPSQLPAEDAFTLSSLKIEYDFGEISLISNTSYFHRNQNAEYDGAMTFLGSLDSFCAVGFCLPTIPAVAGSILAPSGPQYINYGIFDFTSRGFTENTQRNWTQEIRLQSNDPNAALSWVAGIFFQDNEQENIETFDEAWQLPTFIENTLGGDGLTNYFGVPDLLDDETGLLFYGPTTQTDREIAGFGNVTYAIGEKLKLSAGVRISESKFSYDSFFTYPGATETSSGETTSHPVTPRGSITYAITPENMVYASVAEGFRVGGVNGPLLPICEPFVTETPEREYDPDTVWSYEIGAKGRSTDGRFQYAASAYHIDWSDIQQTNGLPACGYSYIANLGEADVDGFDIQGSWRLTDVFTLEYAVGYTDARYNKTTFLSDTPDAPIAVEDGDALNGVVPWTVVIGGVANFHIGDRPAYARFNYEYSSEGEEGPEQNPNTGNFDPAIPVTPSTDYVRLRVGMLFDNVDVSLFVDNLLDESPQLTRGHENSSTLLFTGTTFRPRTAGIALVYRH